MWDLTIPGNNDHDFYIDTAAASALVHNCGAQVVDMNGNVVENPDPIATRLQAHTNQALSEWDNGTLGYSAKDLSRIENNPNLADTIKGNILDARVKTLAGNDNDPALDQVFSNPCGYPGPDWVNTGASPPAGWYDLTTGNMWGQHVYNYAPKYGPGIGILWK
jgi:hypothetical protein